MRAFICKVVVVGTLILGVADMNAWVANAQDDLQAAAAVIRNKKKNYIENTMELSLQEKEAFWPLYAEYESGLSKIRGKRMELATNFLQSHGFLSDDEAIAMLKQKLKIDEDELRFKQEYVAKFMQVLPGRKVARFYQTDNRFDIAALAELYKNIPVIR